MEKIREFLLESRYKICVYKSIVFIHTKLKFKHDKISIKNKHSA